MQCPESTVIAAYMVAAAVQRKLGSVCIGSIHVEMADEELCFGQVLQGFQS